MSIRALRHYIHQIKREGKPVREISCLGNSETLLADCPFIIDNETRSNIILAEDTYVELGPPGRSSYHCVLMASSTRSVKDGLVTVIGPDIPESSGKTLPFGQVLILAGTRALSDMYPGIELCQYTTSRLPGYMIRFSPRRIWSRVGKKAAEGGFNLEILARNILALYKFEFTGIHAMEIVFVTSCDEDVARLGRITERRARTVHSLIKKRYKCDAASDCENCAFSPICERIRTMGDLSGADRKRKREIT